MLAEDGTHPQARQESVLTVRHAAVPGRLRVAVAGLRHAWPQASALVDRLAGDAPGVRASASPRTGTVLLHYPAAWSRDQVLAILEQAWRAVTLGPLAGDDAAVEVRPPAAPWARSADAVLGALAVDGRVGLDTAEVARRQARFGPNRLDTIPPPGLLAALGDQLLNVPIALLGASAALSALTGARLDAAAIAAVVGLNTAIGLATEQGAERAIAALQQASSPRSRVRRDGTEVLVETANLVPGDVLVLERGDFVGADARLITGSDLTVGEASLTGESVGVAKDARAVLAPGTPLADRVSMVFAGTVVMGGSGLAVVTATGAATEMGRVQRLVTSAKPPPTPLQTELDGLGRRLALVVAAVCGLVFVAGLARGQGLLPMLRLAASIAVAAIPEGLPTVATTTLALGVTKMRREGILVRRLDAVEALGQVQVICFDKTGTLTRNRMVLAAVDVGDGAATPRGDDPRHRRLLETAVLATEARVQGNGDRLQIDGSGTEQALIEGAVAAGLDVPRLLGEEPRLGFTARTESTPFVVSRNRRGATERVMLKGSPEALLARASRIEGDPPGPLGEAEKAAWLARSDAMGRRGLRVLGVGWAETVADVAAGRIVWLGLVGLADPLRPGMGEILRGFRRAGAATVMVTGDQGGTACAVASELDLTDGAPLRVLDAGGLARTDPTAFAALANRTDVFARVSPAEKLAIVRALQGSGKIVAMTGDGINDGPALKAADVGVAMGRDGTHAARAVADIVLETDDVGGLALAIAEGRAIYDNIQRAVDYLVATNLSEIGVTAVTTLTGSATPLTPVQLLWLNLVSDVFPALGLAVEPPADDVLVRPPRPRGAAVLSRERLVRRLREGLVMTAAALVAHHLGLRRHGATPAARTLTLSTLVFTQLLHAYGAQAGDGTPAWRRRGRANPALHAAVLGTMALQGVAAFVPPLRHALGIVVPTGRDVATAVALSAGCLAINELAKERWPRPSAGEQGDLDARKLRPYLGIGDGGAPGQAVRPDQ